MITACIKAFNPYYGIELLATIQRILYSPEEFPVLNRKALYSDLGHCGKWNIRYSWIFVKILPHPQLPGPGAATTIIKDNRSC